MAPRKGWRRLRRTAEVPEAPTPEPAGTGELAEIYARALLERAEITEEYFVAQEISENAWRRLGKSPDGRIELAMPYDGCTYFTRAAKADVAHQTASDPLPGSSAVIGHMLLNDYAMTDLGERFNLGDRHGSIAIEVPVGDGGLGNLEQLSADQWVGATTHGFRPGDPEVIPAWLDIDLYDPDSLNLPHADLRDLDLETDEGRQRVNDRIAEIAQQVSFKDELVLHIVVHVSLPVLADHGRLQPKLARMAIDWPTITSLRTLGLHVGEPRPRDGRPLKLKEAPFRYNPVEGCVEWYEVSMFDVNEKSERPDKKHRESGDSEKAGKAKEAEEAEDGADGEEAEDADDAGNGEENEGAEEDEAAEGLGDEPGVITIRHYQSAPMLLTIRHPGELYKEPVLKAAAEVRVPDYLMSGMTARLYDAAGYFLKDPLALTTRIHATAGVRLDDAFRRRDRSPSQHLFFDEILPEEMRITDITTVLEDRGFEVKKVWPKAYGPQHHEAANTDSWLHVAHRKVGPDDMILWIFAIGRQFGTERETVVHGGGVTHTTNLPSGELRIVIRGSLPGDSEGRLTHEMNVLQRMLRERYGRVRQRR